MTSDYNFQKAREAWGDANPPVTPAPRKWVGLTDDEVAHIADSEWEEAFVRLIEAKLKEKNI
jgi:hypothetical protein